MRRALVSNRNTGLAGLIRGKYSIGLRSGGSDDYAPMPHHERFTTLAAEFETLEARLEKSTDPGERRGLLAEMQPILKELQRLAQLRLAELSKVLE